MVCHESLGSVILKDAALTHDEHHVTFDYSVESMGDGNNTGTFKFFINELLRGLFSDDVDVGCGLVKDNDAI